MLEQSGGSSTVCFSTLTTFLLSGKQGEFRPGQTLWGMQMSQTPVQIMWGSSIRAMRLFVCSLD